MLRKRDIKHSKNALLQKMNLTPKLRLCLVFALIEASNIVNAVKQSKHAPSTMCKLSSSSYLCLQPQAFSSLVAVLGKCFVHQILPKDKLNNLHIQTRCMCILILSKPVHAQELDAS